MATVTDTVVFVEDLLYSRAPLTMSTINSLLRHQMLVRNRLLSSSFEQWEKDAQQMELSRQVLAPLDGVPQDPQGVSLRYVVLFDNLLASIVRRFLAVVAAPPIAAAASSTEVLLKTINVFLGKVKFLCSTIKALTISLFREVDISRKKYQDRPIPGHAINTFLAGSIVAAAFKPLSIISEGLKQTILTTFRVGIQSWWNEEIESARWAHALHELRVTVLEVSGPSTQAMEWILMNLKILLGRTSLAHQSPAALREYVSSMHRRLSTLSLGTTNVPRQNFLTNAPIEMQTAVRSLITESVVVPLRSVLAPMIKNALVSGDVKFLESVSYLERLTTFTSTSAHHYDPLAPQLRMTRWFEEQLRVALIGSLREVVSTALGMDQSKFQLPDWSHAVSDTRGQKMADVSEQYIRTVGSIAEWLEQKSTMLRFVYSSDAARASESDVRQFVKSTLHDSGRKLFQNAGALLATMLHAALASKKDQELAFIVTEAAFAWAADKDAFLQQMSHCLELRLLESMPISPDVAERERSVIATLKAQDVSNCGIQLRKLESMLHDAETQKDIEEAIKLQSSMDATLGGIVPPNFDVHLCILKGNTLWHTIGCNPIVRTLPMEVRLAMRVVEHAHRVRWPDKKLSWAHASSRCTLVLAYTKQGKRPPVELTVTLVGASILCMFDNLGSDQVLRTELQEFVMVPPLDAAATGEGLNGAAIGDVVRLFDVALQRLIGLKVLTQESVGGHDTIIINRGFAPPARKLTAVPRSQLSALGDAQTGTRQTADDSLAKTRFLALKAAIVRIMKTRRECAHGSLFDAAVRQLDKTFLPTTQRFKQVIADLIETEYIARKEGEVGVYTYLA